MSDETSIQHTAAIGEIVEKWAGVSMDNDSLHDILVIMHTALSQAQAAAERAERERDDEREWFELARRTAIRHKQRGDTYRNRALALLKQLDFYRWAAVELTAAEAERDALRAALGDMIDLVLDGCVNSMALPEYLRDGDTITVERGYADKFRAAHAALAAAAPGDETETYTTPPHIVDFASGTGALGNPPFDASTPGERP